MKASTWLFSLTAILAVTACSQAGTVIFSEDFEDGTSSLGESGAALTVVADPTDPTNSVGAIDISGGGFVNVNSNFPQIALPAGAVDATFSVDFLVPDPPIGSDGDFFFLEIQLQDAAGDTLASTSGPAFPPLVTATSSFASISTNTLAVPAGATQFLALVIAGDGGAPAGTAFFIDNLTVEATIAPTAIPEPVSASLAMFGATALCVFRRRK